MRVKQGPFKDIPVHKFSLTQFLKDKLNIITQCSLGTKFSSFKLEFLFFGQNFIHSLIRKDVLLKKKKEKEKNMGRNYSAPRPDGE